MNWFSQLPLELQKSAYVFGDEAAWPKEDALEVIRVLSAPRRIGVRRGGVAPDQRSSKNSFAIYISVGLWLSESRGPDTTAARH